MLPFPTINTGTNHPGRYVEALFWASPEMQKCLRVFQEELSLKLEFEGQGGQDFFFNLTLQLKLYGYAVFRARSKGAEVLDGSTFTLERSPKTHAVKPILSVAQKSTKGWHLMIMDPPSFSPGGGLVQARGSGAQSQALALEMLAIKENALARDWVNSRPTIYTRVSSQLKAGGQSARPWFHAQHAQMVPSDVAGTVDFNTLIRSRGETLRGLDTLTADSRGREQQSAAEKQHSELIVSDGRDMNEVRHLPQDAGWIEWRTRTITNSISELWQVPPAATGHNVNSERQAGASRLSEVVLLRWERHLRRYASFIAAAYKLVGLKVTQQNCLSHYDLHQLEVVADPEFLLGMYACVFGVDAKALSVANIRQMQASILGGNAVLQTKNKTSEEKTEQRTDRANGK